MSLDFSLYRSGRYDDNNEMFISYVFQYNVTHNLTRMADRANIYNILWRPVENDYIKAKDIITILENGLNDLIENKDEYDRINPSNGWGTCTGLIKACTEILEACKKYPEALILSDV